MTNVKAINVCGNFCNVVCVNLTEFIIISDPQL